MAHKLTGYSGKARKAARATERAQGAAETRERVAEAETERRDAALLRIARHYLALETLDTRNSDALDFSEQSVWALKEALRSAYRAGLVEGARKR